MVLYVDGPEIEVELVVDAPANRVWELIADPSLPSRYSEELVEAGWGDHQGDEPGIGSIIKGRNFNAAIGEWTSSSHVTAWKPGEVFAWAVREVDDSASRWRFELEERAGQTVLRQHYRIGPGVSGLTRFIEADPANEEQIIAERLVFQETNMMRTLEAVKAMAEAEPLDD